jgi:hydrogenase-4 component E
VTHGFAFDVAHMLAGSLVLVSIAMLYQDRLYALINVLALHALVLAAAVGWQAYIQQAPHLYITAGIALGFKAIVIPWRCAAWCSASASIARSRRW